MGEANNNLSYTFLGSDSNPSRGKYTPLIVPGQLSTDIATSSAELPKTTTTQQNNGSSTVDSQNTPVTPFSKIRNYYIKKIENNNLENVTKTTVDVLNDYNWTISPKSSKRGYSNYDQAISTGTFNDETPSIILKEKYFLVNNLIAQGLYSFSSALDVSKSVTTLISNLGSRAAESLNEFTAGAAEIDNTGSVEALSNISSSVKKFVEGGLDKAGEFTGINTSAFLNYNNPDLEAVLFPYQRLYFVGSTGFNYKLPYLNKSILNLNNNFGDQQDSSIKFVPELVDNITSALESGAGMLQQFLQAGSTKIERTKYYQYSNQSDPIDIVIPLYNTKPSSYSDICNNFKLILLLLYQNLPLRQDKIIVEPPVLYDVTIPGNRREPYCYVSQLNIIYKGNTRMMDIDISSLGTIGDIALPESGFIKTTIPDAYEVRLQLQPMIASTKNLLFTTISDNVVEAS